MIDPDDLANDAAAARRYEATHNPEAEMEALRERIENAAQLLFDARLWCKRDGDIADAAEAVLDDLARNADWCGLQKAVDDYRDRLSAKQREGKG